MQVGTKDELY